MELTAFDRCGFCWSLLADGMSPLMIRKMDRVVLIANHLGVANAEI